MADPIYVVTLKNRDDLDKFYADMKSDGYKISLKRPISRSTHYHMTDLQAENLRGDSRVLAVEKRPEDLGIVRKPCAQQNNTMHVHSGNFRKQGTFQPIDLDWGKLHCGGTDAQRQKNVWGYAKDIETHTVETHVYRLRKKISDSFKDDKFILSDDNGYFL